MQILGTRTYFHQGKVYQERLDSDHLMVIDQIREENPEKPRRELDWQNPQADVKIRYKHKKSYYNLLSKLSTNLVKQEFIQSTRLGLTNSMTTQTKIQSPFSRPKMLTLLSRLSLQNYLWNQSSKNLCFFANKDLSAVLHFAIFDHSILWSC